MRFLVLGPLEVVGEDGAPLLISGAKERLILAYLIARAGLVVSVDDLIDELWGERPPRTAEKTLGSYISRLRRAIEPGPAGAQRDLIVTRGDGYELQVADDDVDAIRFEALAEEGRRLLAAGDMNGAASTLDEALRVWRGDAYQGLRYTGFGASEADRLDELRRSALEDRVDARLAFAASGTLVAELEGLVREAPLRERRWGQLMVALYRVGRQAEALDTYRRAREVLVNELGIEPGPDLQRIQAAILRQDPAIGRGTAIPAARADVCPYKGLARFERVDADFFFGRENAVTEGIARLVGGDFLGLVGASGSGKSSLLRAGILHALEGGAVPGSDRWTYAIFRPGRHPLESLTQALAPVAAGPALADIGQVLLSLATSSEDGRFVIAVDQFEEAFTACDDDEERKAFLDAITEPALVRDGRVTLLLAMRADLYGRCAEHRGLASLLATSQLLVGPMSSDELRRAIDLPAEHAGLRVEPELTEALVEDVGGRPGGLPLLSTALLELWQRRRDGTLRLDEYRRSGGVDASVARLADEAFGRLDPAEQDAARRILMRLAGPGRGDDVVGRRASLTEFDLDRDPDASRALAVLADARLVTLSEGTIEVAHEALLREWPRLRDWLEEDAEGRRLHRHLAEIATAWDASGRDAGDLYRGARLATAIDWSHAHQEDLNDVEREFLALSRDVSENEAARARRTNRRLRGLLVGVALLLLLALIVGNLALTQRNQAQAAAKVADARQLAARSLGDQDLIRSLLLAREAVALDDSPQTQSALLTALQRDPAAIAEMHADGAVLGDLTEWLQLSPDGHVIATGGDRTTVDLFDATTYQPIGVIDVGAGTTAGDFSADGGTLAVAAVNQRIVGIDVNARKVRTTVTTEGRGVDAVLFVPEGGPLLTAESNQERGFLVPRDPVTLERSGDAVPSGSGRITAMASSRDGHRLVTTGLPPESSVPGGHTALWKARDLEQVGDTFPVGGNDVALSPDGRTAAIAAAESEGPHVGSLEGRIVLLNLRTGKEHFSPQARAPGQGGGLGLTGVAFAADGRSVISTGDDHRVLIWDESSATIQEAFDDPAGLVVFTPVPSPDGTTVFTIDVDGNVVAWDLMGDRRSGRSFTAGSGATYSGGSPWFAISPDGSTLAIVQSPPHGGPGSLRLVDTSTLEGIGVIPNGFSEGLAFSPDGGTLAVTSVGYVQLWDVRTGSPEGPPLLAPGSDRIEFWTAAFSADGSTLATAGANWHSETPGNVFLWDVTTGQPIGRLPEQGNAVSTVSYSPDGALLVASTGYGQGVGPAVGDVIIWNVDQSQTERTIPADDSGVAWADMSNDGTKLVTGGQSGRERLWDLSTGQPIGPALNGPTNTSTVDLSPDGRTLVAAGPGQVIMWDVATGTVLGRSFFPDVGPEDNLAATFAPDGRRLIVVSETGEGWVWDVDPASWEQRACQIAGRSLTQAEWQIYLPDRPYHATCGS
jgi:WD40 repeat protein/DNA-binding SARP family transcriptional activator